MENEQSKSKNPLDNPKLRFDDEETAKELADRVVALSPLGRSLVAHALMQHKPAMVVATACDEIGVSGVLEQMAGWCYRVGVLSTDEGKPADAAQYRWRENLLRAFQQAVEGPPQQN